MEPGRASLYHSMKARFVFNFFLCSTLSTVDAQSFVDTSNVWSIQECWNFGPCYPLYYRFIGDTLLDGQIYRKLYISTLPDVSAGSLAVMMREDSDHVVYGYQDTSEFVYYDMDMAVGDSVTVTTNGCPWEITFVVYSHDTLTLLNGEQRRRWQLVSDGWMTDTWIEGIGSVWGPFSHQILYCTADIYWYLNCFTQNDTLKYQAFPSCGYTTVGMTQLEEEHIIQVMPNPFHGDVRLTTDGPCPNGTVEVRDVFGRIVLQGQGDLASGVTLDASGLRAGMYTMQCTCNGDHIVARRLVKQ
jgi:hypothetical protein